MDYKKLGQRVREYRIRSNMTQDKLAEAAELSTIFISQIETGKRKPSLSTVIKLANLLSIPIESLVRDSVEKNESVKKNELIKLLEGRSEKEVTLAIDTLRAIWSHVKDDTLT